MVPTDHNLCILQIGSDHQGQVIQIKFLIYGGWEHVCLLDVVERRTRCDDVVDS